MFNFLKFSNNDVNVEKALVAKMYLKQNFVNDTLNQIAKEYCSRISDDKLEEIETVLSNSNPNEFVKEFYKWVESNYMYGTTEIPTEVLELTNLILNREKNNIYLDVTTGYGRSITMQEDTVNLIGYELDHDIVNIANMLIELKFNGNIKNVIEEKNILSEDITYFDNGICFPRANIPFSRFESIIDGVDKKMFNPRSGLEWVIINKMISKMNNCSKFVAILHDRCLFSLSDKIIKEKILDDGLIEGIIRLPNNVFYGIHGGFNLVVFSKNNKSIKVLDARDMIDANKSSRRINVIDLNLIFSKYSNTISIDYFNAIAKNDLRVDSLLAEEIVVKNATILSEVCDIFQGSQYTISNFKENISLNKTNCCLITSSDMEDGFVKWDSITYINNDPKLEKFAVHKNDIIMTSKSSKLKISIVDVEPSSISIVTGGMFIIRPNIEKINPVYLKMFLASKQGLEILKLIQKGVTIPVITLGALKSIAINCPGIEFQNSISKKYMAKQSMYVAMKQELMDMENTLNNFLELEMGDDL